MKSTRRQTFLAGLALAAILVLLILAFKPWQMDGEPVILHYESTAPSISFDFVNRSMEKSLNVTLNFSIEDRSDVKSAQGFVNLNVTIAERYPDSARGEVGCWTNITVNDVRWYGTHFSSGFEPSSPEEWGTNRDEPQLQSTNLTYPKYLDESHLESLLQPGLNVIQASADCSTRIDSTGPGAAIVSLSPLRAVIRTG